MRNALRVGLVLALALGAGSRAVAAQDAAVVTAPEPWTAEELENLLAPIALYPDPILAQVLIAATFPDQIALAAAYVQANGTVGLDAQPWEISVKAVAYYAPVLNMMAEGEDWTIALGQAYAEQSDDVMSAVQSLRRMANAQGNLVTTSEQRVIVEPEVIRIVPAQPRVVYVPTYDPAVIYFRPIYVAHAHPAYWSFGIGYPIGVWLTYDFDWYHHRVYYHGWHGHGWIVASRPWIVINPIYISPRHTVIVVNRRVVHRPFNPYRIRRVVHRHATYDRHDRWGRGRGVARNDRDGGRRDGPGYGGRDDGDRRNGGRATPTPRPGGNRGTPAASPSTSPRTPAVATRMTRSRTATPVVQPTRRPARTAPSAPRSAPRSVPRAAPSAPARTVTRTPAVATRMTRTVPRPPTTASAPRATPRSVPRAAPSTAARTPRVATRMSRAPTAAAPRTSRAPSTSAPRPSRGGSAAAPRSSSGRSAAPKASRPSSGRASAPRTARPARPDRN